MDDTAPATEVHGDEAAGRPAIGAFDPSCYAVPYSLLPASIKSARQALGLPGEGMEFKSLPTEIKATKAQRRLEIWIAAHGNVDEVGETIPYGAAEKSIKTHGPKSQGGTGQVKLFFNHSVLLGPLDVLEQHQKGIFASGLVVPHPSMDLYLDYAESAAADKGSIGYVVKRRSKTTIKGVPAISLDEIELFEGSLVIWPANQMCDLAAVKSWRSKSLPGSAAPPVAPEQKSLFGLSEVICAMERLQDALRTLRWAQESEYSTITPEERAVVDMFLDVLTKPPAEGAQDASLLATVMQAVMVMGGEEAAAKSLRAKALDPGRDPKVLAAMAALTQALRA